VATAALMWLYDRIAKPTSAAPDLL
jgi:hypothetical protein